ncbi:hypothetical protein PR048_020371 [Dryococelus australis]|uniref:Uncharacterized protein n=1 Tax=Dryococelus australis TaxID=614101 RepID=A0ABQ9H666_9NEOP|nr:hypothetical protein PR048_020371 [Dryococelus australis]
MPLRRFVEKHDAILTFLDTLPGLHVVLETISESSESRGSNAFSFLHAIQSSEFLVSVVVLAELHAEYMDVLDAIKIVEAILGSLREQRYKSTDTFKKIFKESEKLAMEMGTQINKPRTTNLQKNTSNFNSQTVEEYCRTAVCIPFMDFIINFVNQSFKELDRFKSCCRKSLVMVLKAKFWKVQDHTRTIFLCFFDFERRITSLEADMEIRPFTKVSKVSCERLQTGFCTTKHYSSVSILMCPIGCNKHSGALSSTLRRLKTYLRSTDIASAIKHEEFLDNFARKHKRKLSLNFL